MSCRLSVLFQHSFRLFKSGEWIVYLKCLTVWNRVFRCEMEKTLQFSTTFLLIGIESCLEFFQKMAFFSPRLVYQRFSWRSSLTLLTWFRKRRHFQADFQFCCSIIVSFSCYQLAFGISQVNKKQVLVSSDFDLSSVFGLTYKHVIRFGVAKATFWCEFMELRLFRSLWFEALWH